MLEGQAAHAERRCALRRPVESLEPVVVEHRAERVEQLVGPGEHPPQELRGSVVKGIDLRIVRLVGEWSHAGHLRRVAGRRLWLVGLLPCVGHRDRGDLVDVVDE